MKLDKFLQHKIVENNTVIETLQKKIDEIKGTLKDVKTDNGKAEAISELTNINFRAVFHKGVVAAYSDILNEYTVAIEKRSNEKS